MSSTTPKTKAASPAVVAPSQIGDKTKPVNPLQKYLEKVYPTVRPDLGPDFGEKTHIPISIYLQGKSHNHKYAGMFDDEHHFSASLLKVAAMFAAYKLRKEALLLADEIKNGTATAATPAQFFNKLSAKFKLTDAVSGITSVAAANKKPSYGDVLSVTGLPSAPKVDLSNDFKDHMRKMIIPSNNCSAGECIVRLGYPYINAKLMEDRFFDGTTWNTPAPKGIWLAGDFIDPGCFNATKKLPYVRITTVNDCHEVTHFCGSAQNTSSREMARFFFQILLEKLVDDKASGEMFDLLRDAQAGPDPSFVSRVTSPALLFNVEGVKIGQAGIKKDSDRGNIEVRSEGIIINWLILDATEQKKWDDMNLTGNAAICWQNLPNDGTLLPGIAKLINQTISKFINQDPI